MSARDELARRLADGEVTEIEAYRTLSRINAANGDELAAAERWGSASPEESRRVVDSWNVPEDEVQRVIRNLGLERRAS